MPYEYRKEMVKSIKYVDEVIPETNWNQKVEDIKRLGIDVLVMGDDWKGSDKFEYLKQFCDVVFLPKMEGLSSTKFRGHVEEYVKLMEEDE